MDHAGQGNSASGPQLSDFEVTVEYPAHAAAAYLSLDEPTQVGHSDEALETVPDGSRPDIPVPSYLSQPAPVRDAVVRDAVDAALLAADDTAVCEQPSEIRAIYAAPSHSLIADAEAIVSAFRQRSEPELLWAQRVAMQVANLPAPPRKQPWWSRAGQAIVSFADRVGGAIVDSSVATYKWLQSSALARRLRNRPCQSCSDRRASHNLYFDLPASLSNADLSHHVGQRSWDLFRCVGLATTKSSYIQVTIRRCRRCVDDTSVEINAYRNGRGELVANDMPLGDDESYFLLSLVG
ncbi:MAG: hypothetical protein KJO07_18980 [Deltaproteobacteria bacterium]|nr:hypothetical protein [Deltaproteobacteria bacterium]